MDTNGRELKDKTLASRRGRNERSVEPDACDFAKGFIFSALYIRVHSRPFVVLVFHLRSSAVVLSPFFVNSR
jgi:hypothetical protein